MFLPAFIGLLVTSSVSSALRCYAGGPVPDNGSVSVPLQECHQSALSCMRTVDLKTSMASFFCSSAKCNTTTGDVSSVPICFNTTDNLQTICCCYTDGCNSSAAPSYNLCLSRTVVIVFICMLTSYIGKSGRIQ